MSNIDTLLVLIEKSYPPPWDLQLRSDPQSYRALSVYYYLLY